MCLTFKQKKHFKVLYSIVLPLNIDEQ